MWCDNLPRTRGRFSQVTSVYKLLTTIVLRLNEIRYCSIVAKSSLEILAYHSLSKNQTRKIQKIFKKKCDN